jgi:hypothetical protein
MPPEVENWLASRSGSGGCRRGAGEVHALDTSQDCFQAGTGVGAGIHVGMAAAIGVHDQHAGLFARLLHHVGQVMTVIAAEGGAQHDQVKGTLAQGFFDCFAPAGLLHGVTGLFDGSRLPGKDFRVPFAVKNLQLCCLRHKVVSLGVPVWSGI